MFYHKTQHKKQHIYHIFHFNTTISNIKNLMKTTNWSAENAMKALGIAPSEYKKYLMML